MGWLRNMLPRLSRGDECDRGLRNAVSNCERAVGYAEANCLTDLGDVLLRQSCVGVSRAPSHSASRLCLMQPIASTSRHSPLPGCVSHVLGVGADSEVRRLNAPRVVAQVHRDAWVSAFEPEDDSGRVRDSLVDRDDPVAANRCPSPLPTTARQAWPGVPADLLARRHSASGPCAVHARSLPRA